MTNDSTRDAKRRDAELRTGGGSKLSQSAHRRRPFRGGYFAKAMQLLGCMLEIYAQQRRRRRREAMMSVVHGASASPAVCALRRERRQATIYTLLVFSGT